MEDGKDLSEVVARETSGSLLWQDFIELADGF